MYLCRRVLYVVSAVSGLLALFTTSCVVLRRIRLGAKLVRRNPRSPEASLDGEMESRGHLFSYLLRCRRRREERERGGALRNLVSASSSTSMQACCACDACPNRAAIFCSLLASPFTNDRGIDGGRADNEEHLFRSSKHQREGGAPHLDGSCCEVGEV